VLSDIFTSKRFKLRLKEIKVPAKIRKCFPKYFPLGRESFVLHFGPIGKALQQASFYVAASNTFIAVMIVGVTKLTSAMYAISVKANWQELSVDMPDLDMDQAMSRVTGTVSGLGDSAMGLITILASGVTAMSYDLGGMPWLLVNVVSMEKFFVLGSGLVISGVAFKMGFDYPAGNWMFAPMGLCGAVTMFFGAVKAVPWFEKKFPDIMYMLHKAQLVVIGFLAAIFVLLISAARGTKEFISENWDGCHYKIVCESWPVESPDWSFKEYAAEQNMDMDDLEQVRTMCTHRSVVFPPTTCVLSSLDKRLCGNAGAKAIAICGGHVMPHHWIDDRWRKQPCENGLPSNCAFSARRNQGQQGWNKHG
jgi:hypothetical protein